jgi:uncharacterized membrane protein required for colicin V production
MIDAVFIVYLLINALLGFRYGLFRRIVHIGGFYLGLLLAQAISPGFAQVANFHTGTHPTDGHFLAFLVVLFGLVIIVEGLTFAFGSTLDSMSALIFDRFFGLTLGCIAAVFEMGAVLYLFGFMYATPLPSGSTHTDITSAIHDQASTSPSAKALSQLRPYIVVLYGPVLPPDPGIYFARTIS